MRASAAGGPGCPDDDFFGLGGNSLLAVRLAEVLRAAGLQAPPGSTCERLIVIGVVLLAVTTALAGVFTVSVFGRRRVTA